jgi:tight adherence protein C
MLGIIVAIGAVGVSVVVAMLVGRRDRSPSAIEKRLAEYAESPVSLDTLELEQPFSERVLKPILARCAKMVLGVTPQKSMERLARNLQIAGNPNGMQPADFMGLRVLASFLMGGLLTFLLFISHQSITMILLGGGIFFMIGFVLPASWLGGKMKKRRKLVFRALPDAIDLLTISVEAGLGFDQALTRVSEKWDNDLCREFRRVLSEVRVGKPQREALRDMATRCDVADLSVFVASIVQAQQLGVSMTKVLRIQADQMRIRRRQIAEELAHKAPLKMLFPMVFLIFPAMYIVILGPAVPVVAASMGG